MLLLSRNLAYSKKFFAYLKKIPKDHTIVYVTVNHSVKKIAKKLDDVKIDSDNVFFIQAITGESYDADNCISLPSLNLTQLNIAINQAISHLDNRVVLVFDSVTTLELYHSEKNVDRFAHSVISWLQSKSIDGVILALSNTSKAATFLKGVVDEVVVLK